MSAASRFARPVLAVLACLVASVPMALSSSADVTDDDAGSAGTDTSLSDTDSAVTVHGRGAFADLEIQINQTENLANQAISIKWSGAAPTIDANRVRSHFLQIMQCWGDDDGSVAENPGPPPEQCVFGASDAQPGGGRNANLFAAGSYADDRIISRETFESYKPDDGALEPKTGEQWMPFRAVDGEEITTHIDPEFSPVDGGNFWLNPYFDYVTTNEIAAGRALADGTGQELFEVVTGLESSGLGCGQTVLEDDDGDDVEPQCWLVIVPRAGGAEENAGTIDDPNFEQNDAVMTSPLAPGPWKNRIAVPLEFNSVDTVCEIVDEPRRMVGSELPVRAISSWQPTLCADDDLTPYSYAIVSDDSARLQLGGTGLGSPGLAVVSRPFDPLTVNPADPVVYAPVTLSGLVIGFNVERLPDTTTAGPKTEALKGVRVAELNLTPRLVAKLLTQSYAGQVAIGGGDPPDDYDWVEDNPRHIDADPDFLRFNPEFELLRTSSEKYTGGLVLAAGTSDAAWLVWEWILADPEAKQWLDGEEDEWGMRVNPVYATSEDENPSGVPFAPPTPLSFPKSDPYCYEADEVTLGTVRITPPALCGTDWFPYALGFGDAARKTRAAIDDAKVVANLDARDAQQYWKSSGPQLPGQRSMLALIDSASARQYGLQMARLSRAGDNSKSREFIAPDEDGLLAALDTMEEQEGSTVLLPVQEADVADGYPLATLSYAAVKPVGLDDLAREEYAAFIEYAAGDGQDAGEEVGQLPPGYVPLPKSLRAQATTAATLVRDPSSLVPPPEPEPEPAAPSAEPVTPVSTPPPAAASAEPVASIPVTRPRASAPVSPTSTVPFEIPDTPAPPREVSAPSTVPSRSLTPATDVGNIRFAVPMIAAVVLLSALGALEVTKRPRRAPLSAARPTAPHEVTS